MLLCNIKHLFMFVSNTVKLNKGMGNDRFIFNKNRSAFNPKNGIVNRVRR